MRHIHPAIKISLALTAGAALAGCSSGFQASKAASTALSSSATPPNPPGATPTPPSPTATPTPPSPTASPTPPPAASPTPPPPGGSFAAPFTPVRTVTVCASGCNYQLPSQAIANAQNFDLITVQAGDYVDCAFISTANLWIKGVGGGMAKIHDKVCGSKGAFVAGGQSLTVENLEFYNLNISAALGKNAAGIRGEAGEINIRNSHFHDNQNGILINPTVAKVTIENSRFERNGVDGYEHNMYINNVNEFSIRNSVSIDTREGHEIKSRAKKTTVECNFIKGGYSSGYSDSYNVDLSNGGDAIVRNNLIAQGPFQSNPAMVTFAPEGASNPVQKLDFSGNIVINDFGSGDMLAMFNAPTSPSVASNNKFIGGGNPIGGGGASALTTSGNSNFGTRAAAGLGSSDFPMPAACSGPIGLVAVP